MKAEAGAEWTNLKVVDMFTRMVCRMSNRVFVGLPVCACDVSFRDHSEHHIHRDIGRIPEYCGVNIQFAVNVMIGGFFINLFPESMKPYDFRATFRLSIKLILSITGRLVGSSLACLGISENCVNIWVLSSKNANRASLNMAKTIPISQ